MRREWHGLEPSVRHRQLSAFLALDDAAVRLVVEQIGVRFLTFIDQSLQWVPTLEVTAAEASDALTTIASLTIAFVVFTFGSMLVALQVASAQLTPRIIATTLLRDNTIRFTVGPFVFTLLLAVGTKARLHDPLPLAMVVHVKRRAGGPAEQDLAAGVRIVPRIPGCGPTVSG